jgi:hypothetical protein
MLFYAGIKFAVYALYTNRQFNIKKINPFNNLSAYCSPLLIVIVSVILCNCTAANQLAEKEIDDESIQAGIH